MLKTVKLETLVKGLSKRQVELLDFMIRHGDNGYFSGRTVKDAKEEGYKNGEINELIISLMKKKLLIDNSLYFSKKRGIIKYTCYVPDFKLILAWMNYLIEKNLVKD